MRILITLSLFISAIAFGQNESGIDITKSEQTLIGKWEFIKTLDQNGKEVKKISLDRSMPNGKPMTLNANGPNIIINSDRTYTKVFTPENSDTGYWRIKSENEIEYEMVIPKDSRQGRLILQTQKLLPNKKWRKDDNGNFLDASSDKIIELTETEMKVEYEKEYYLIYRKKITKTTLVNEQFDFLNDCIEVFSKLNESTNEFYSTLENNTNSEILKTNITTYNNELVLFSLNKLSKHTKSENSNIKEVATDLTNLTTDLVKMNYEYLNYVTNSKYSENELKKKNKSLVEQNKFASNFYREISLGICMTLVKSNPNKKEDKQFSELTLNQRDLLNSRLKHKLGKSVKKGTKIESKNSFEHSLRIIYEFLNMEWEFEKE
jgi:hypothetical protein